MANVKKYKPKMWLDLSEVIKGMQLHGLDIGYDGNIYILATSEHIERRDRNFPRIRLDNPVDYTVLQITPHGDINSYTIHQQNMVFSFVQPLPNDELLLVNTHAKYRNQYDYDRNAKVFSPKSDLLRQFSIGSGVNHLQTTSTGSIWVGYGDEGTHGNWDKQFGSAQPLGHTGVVEWSGQGEKLFAVEQPVADTTFYDCYAMNVQNDEVVWFYYFDGFPLVRLVNRQVETIWRKPISGAKCLIVSDKHIVIHKENRFKLFRINEGERLKGIIEFKMVPSPKWQMTRGDTFVYLNNTRLYRLTIADWLSAV